jgi:hypothetical protein
MQNESSLKGSNRFYRGEFKLQNEVHNPVRVNKRNHNKASVTVSPELTPHHSNANIIMTEED